MDNIGFDEYQKKIARFAIYPHKGEFLGTYYCVNAAHTEAGELAEKFKKLYRDRDLEPYEKGWRNFLSVDERVDFAKEMGDQLWYIAQTGNELGLGLNYVANLNYEKLADREKRGVLGGKGDNR